MSIKAKIERALLRYLPEKEEINPKTIADEVFRIIEAKPILLDLYHRSWGGESVNSLISKIVKEHYMLANEVDDSGNELKNHSPTSTLIDSYQIFRF